MKEIKKGSTSITEYFNLLEKTAGTAKTGLTAANIYIGYTRNRATLVAAVGTALAAVDSAWTSLGVKEVDSTNAPGLYRIDVPDAAFATGVDKVILSINVTVSSSVAPAMKEVLLVDQIANDIYTIVATVGAAVDWAKVLNKTTANDLSGTLISRAQTIIAVTGAVGSVSGGVTGSVGSVVGNVGGSVGSVVGNVGGSVGSVVGGVGGAVAGSVGSVSGGVTGSVGSVVGNVGGSVASVVGNVGGSVGSVVGGVGGAVASVTNTVTANVSAVSASQNAADRLARAAGTEVLVTIGSGSTTTSIVASSFSPASAVNDQWNGRILIFAADTTTTALRGQATDITDYVHGTLTMTVTALTTAPSSGDTAVIV